MEDAPDTGPLLGVTVACFCACACWGDAPSLRLLYCTFLQACMEQLILLCCIRVWANCQLITIQSDTPVTTTSTVCFQPASTHTYVWTYIASCASVVTENGFPCQFHSKNADFALCLSCPLRTLDCQFHCHFRHGQ